MFYQDEALVRILQNVVSVLEAGFLPVVTFDNVRAGESALGTSPNAALRTVRERLRSYSSRYPTGDPRPNLQ